MEDQAAAQSEGLRHAAGDLLTFATTLLERAGLARERARTVAEVLLEGDLLGHTTHGLELLPAYLTELTNGGMAVEGEPRVVADLGAAITWDGGRLPGPWLVRRAIAEARSRVPVHPVVSLAIRRSHHIACLQAYLKPVTDAGLVILLLSSDPANTGVAPHGGVVPCLTPNPIAAGWPTAGDPVLLDISMSTTTNAMVKRVRAEGGRLPGPWLVDAHGVATDAPSALTPDGGALLPLGGLDLGHKGFGLALLVEALTSGLAGYGRADRPTEWGASVFLQIMDPDAFGGRDAFVREAQFIADRCREARVPDGQPPVRLPGERALARRRRLLREGVPLRASTRAGLAEWAERFDVPLPRVHAESA